MKTPKRSRKKRVFTESNLGSYHLARSLGACHHNAISGKKGSGPGGYGPCDKCLKDEDDSLMRVK